MENKKFYISSDGSNKDVTQLDYQYLVNAIAKAFRNLNEVNSVEEFIKNSNNVCILQDELLERNKKYYDEHFGG